MANSAQLVKELRERTGAGLMECKKAIEGNDGNIDKAIIFLKEKGIAKASEKSGRNTKEGIICISIADNNAKGIVVEINCETDFVARTDDFLNTCQELTNKILSSNSQNISELSDDVQTDLKAMISRLGENMSISNIKRLENNSLGYLSSYIHQGGQIGVLLQLETAQQQTQQQPEFLNLSKDISMHIAAMNPVGIDQKSVDPAAVKEQEAIAATQAKESGKPEKIVPKIVQGKMRQFYKEIVLLEQDFVKEPKLSVQKYIDSQSKKLNDQIKIVQFIRFKVGE